MTLTPEDLDAIEARANAATRGPWTGEFMPEHGDAPIVYAEFNYELIYKTHDRDFINAARTDVPALVAEVRRLRAEIERMRSDFCECGRGLRNMCNICDNDE